MNIGAGRPGPAGENQAVFETCHTQGFAWGHIDLVRD